MTKGRRPSTTYTRHMSTKVSRPLWHAVNDLRLSLALPRSTIQRRALWLYTRHPELWDAAREYATPEELASIDGEIGE